MPAISGIRAPMVTAIHVATNSRRVNGVTCKPKYTSSGDTYVPSHWMIESCEGSTTNALTPAIMARLARHTITNADRGVIAESVGRSRPENSMRNGGIINDGQRPAQNIQCALPDAIPNASVTTRGAQRAAHSILPIPTPCGVDVAVTLLRSQRWRCCIDKDPCSIWAILAIPLKISST